MNSPKGKLFANVTNVARSFSQSINWGRHDLGMGIADVAAEIGLKPEFLWQIERGHVIPDRQTILKLALYLRLNATELLTKAESAKRRMAGH
jgi:ribosome-binding protein aMBF1 (putative translation factor)